jgi:O-acetyl-ADP-ribose deacetylase (regulator of RNase III)
MIEYCTGDILKADVEALVNPVNCVGTMGAGLQFKRAFPDGFKEYQQDCRDKLMILGSVRVHHRVNKKPLYIISFPTKGHWQNNSQLSYIIFGARDLVAKVQRLVDVSTVAVPALGCGLGGLEWGKVHAVLVKEFAQVPDVKWMLYKPEEK